MRMLTTALSALGILAVGLSLSAQASVTIDLQPGQNGVTTVEPDQQVLFHFDNPTYTAGTKRIMIGQGSDAEVEVYPMWQDTYYLDATKLKAIDTPYRIVGENGQEIASGTISNKYLYTNSTNLSSIINYSSSYTWDKKSEPNYYTSATPASGSDKQAVRGYW